MPIEAYIQFEPGLITDDGEVTNEETEKFLRNYMAEFHAFITAGLHGPAQERVAMLVWIAAAVIVLLVAVVLHDVTQRQHAILRNFPLVGHFRYWLEAVGPELRQYIVTDNNEERPFSRDQRRWIYASAKRENNYFGFGSDNEMELQPHYLIIKHDTFPLQTYHPGDPEFDPQFRIPCGKVMGGPRQRRRAFRPSSIVNVSGMSFGSLSGPAVEALNRELWWVTDPLGDTERAATLEVLDVLDLPDVPGG